jgi:hypothetical protein
MNVDDATSTRIAVLFARLPISASDTDGLLLRLMDAGNLGDQVCQ